MRKLVQAFVLTAALMVPAFADVVVFNLDREFSGGTPPEGLLKPWLTATFTDFGSGQVQLDLTAQNLTDTEHVTNWYFNFNPDKDPSILTITPDTPRETVQITENSLKADGDGYFDFAFQFVTSNVADRFGASDTFTYTLSGSGLRAADFYFLSAVKQGEDATGPKSLYTAAHVQGIGSSSSGGWITGSGSITVPEASPYLVYGLVLAGLGLGIRQRKAA